MDIPKEIWIYKTYKDIDEYDCVEGFAHRVNKSTKYIRADIADELLEALEEITNLYDEPAGLTSEIVHDDKKFKALVVKAEIKVTAAKNKARRIIEKAKS